MGDVGGWANRPASAAPVRAGSAGSRQQSQRADRPGRCGSWPRLERQLLAGLERLQGFKLQETAGSPQQDLEQACWEGCVREEDWIPKGGVSGLSSWGTKPGAPREEPEAPLPQVMGTMKATCSVTQPN